MFLLHLALAGTAVAQDAIDAHGFKLVPSDGDRLDPLATWRPEAQTPGSFSFAGLIEYAESPLVRMSLHDGVTSREVLVDDLVGIDLGASFAPQERVQIALSAPVWFASVGPEGAAGLGMGDLRAAVPIALVVPGDELDGIGASVVPFVDLPTGASARFLGNSGLAGGGLVAAGWSTERVLLAANLGAAVTPAVEVDNLRGGPRLIGSAAAGVAVTDAIGLRAEAVFQASLAENRVPGTESPAEAWLSARGRYESGLSWTLGGAMPVSYGAGAAAFRVVGGAGWTFGKKPDPDTDLDGLTDSVDPCPTEPEVVNGWRDDDGCPDALADARIAVVNEDGEPVEGVTVVIRGQTFVTDRTGTLELRDLTPDGSLDGAATHPWYREAVLDPLPLAEGPNAGQIVLRYLPGKVRVITKSNQGAILDARVRFDGPVPMETRSVGDDGMEVFDLRPGAWRLLVSAEAFGTERRDLTINPGETSLVVIEVVLYPTKTEVKGTEIKILEQVQFDFDKATIKPESFPLLEQVANVLLDHPEILKVEVQGHTDDRGDDQYNLELSQRRVESVRAYLVEHGVAEERLVAQGYGETQPVASNKNEKGRAQNRRVQFVILEPPPVEAPPANTEGAPQ